MYGRRTGCWPKRSRCLLVGGVLGIDLAIWLVHGRFVRDHATCYKLLRRETLQRFELQSTGFEGCAGITCKLMRSGIPILQVPISYHPRTSDEGKKLTASDGWEVLKSVWRWRAWSPSTGPCDVAGSEIPVGSLADSPK